MIELETQKFLWINFHARCCERLMSGKLWGKYSVGSDSWCRANVRGGICRWRTCMRCFDPDGLGQYSGDRWGKRKEVSCSHRRFSLFLTHLQPRSICYFFFTYTARSALHTASDLQCLLTSFTALFPNFVIFLWAWLKLFTFVVEWTIISFWEAAEEALWAMEQRTMFTNICTELIHQTKRLL